ncbi:MAG: hypothetical protein ACI9RO_002573 [Alteromonas macleodii]|jgi:hypothetical protein
MCEFNKGSEVRLVLLFYYFPESAKVLHTIVTHSLTETDHVAFTNTVLIMQ